MRPVCLNRTSLRRKTTKLHNSKQETTYLYNKELRTVWLVVISCSIYLLAAIIAVVHIHTSSCNVVFADMWGFIPIVGRFLAGKGTWSDLWIAHNENRDVILTAILIASAKIDHLNVENIKYLSVVFNALLFTVLLRFYVRHRTMPVSYIFVAFVPVALMVFSISQWENFIMAINVVFCLAVLLIISTTVVVENNGRYVLLWAIVLSILATISSAEGLVVWPLVAIQWGLRREWHRITAYVAVGLIIIMLYLRDLHQSSGTSYVIHHLVASLHFFVVVLGNSVIGFFNNRPVMGLDAVVGILFLLAGIWTVGQYIGDKAPKTQPQRLAVVLTLFGLGSAAFITMGRVPMGMSMAAASRYSTLTLGVAIGPYLYFLHRTYSRDRVWVGVILGIIMVGFMAGTVEEMHMGIYRLAYFQRLQHTAVFGPYSSSALKPFLWNPAVIRQAIPILKHYHLNVFWHPSQ